MRRGGSFYRIKPPMNALILIVHDSMAAAAPEASTATAQASSPVARERKRERERDGGERQQACCGAITAAHSHSSPHPAGVCSCLAVRTPYLSWHKVTCDLHNRRDGDSRPGVRVAVAILDVARRDPHVVLRVFSLGGARHAAHGPRVRGRASGAVQPQGPPRRVRVLPQQRRGAAQARRGGK